MKNLSLYVASLALLLVLSGLTACEDEPADTPDTADTSDTADTDKDSGLVDTNTGNQAPELERIGDRVAPIGAALIITLDAV
ncbi:MAG: hypothetical protein ACI9MR_003715, partial [Myxococcota bacterium]